MLVIGATNPHARRLRRDATDVEAKLWHNVRNRRLGGYKFRRQATVSYYVVDFLCVQARLIVELDGGQHSAATDRKRTHALARLGFRVSRFWNNEVNENLEGVLQRILEECLAAPSRFRVKGPSANCD
jgi:adenine-specific DNA-methyltransferase